MTMQPVGVNDVSILSSRKILTIRILAMLKPASIVLAALGLSLPAMSFAAIIIFAAAGNTPGAIQSTVDNFRNALRTNNGVGGSFPSGRREINWDGVPDNRAAPNNLPPNFFNANPPNGSPRGATFFSPGNAFQVSANRVNPTGTPPEFGNLNSTLPNLFTTFSPERLFTALNSPIVEVLFFIPGTRRPATTRGFGAVFTDVDASRSTKIDFLDVNGRVLLSRFVPWFNGNETLSFLGATFDTPAIYMVRITSGNLALRRNVSIPAGRDAVVMDDFIYGEPRLLQ